MPTDDEGARPPTAEAVGAAPAEAPGIIAEPGRVHLVVVSTRAVNPGETAPAGAVLRTRFWHPRDRRWSENAFDSLDHALHLFVEESGWVLRQQQALDRPHAHELIFEARRQDFSRPSAEEMLRDVGLTPREVAGLIERVDAERQGK
jgi:hypothetical protein